MKSQTRECAQRNLHLMNAGSNCGLPMSSGRWARTCIVGLAGLLTTTALGIVHAAELDNAAKGYKYLRCERQGAVYVARFYNPPDNLLNAALVNETRDLLKKVESDKETRVLIFTGGIPNYFIKHFDVAEIKKVGDAIAINPSLKSTQGLNSIDQALLEIEGLSKPVIAAINGHAQGGGLELALACDFRIIDNPGILGFPEVNSGFVPGGGGTVRLPRLIGIPRAKELIMMGQPIDAATAERWGLVTKVVPPDQLMPEAMRLAERLVSLPPTAIAAAKKLINASGEVPMRDAFRLEEEAFSELLDTEDARSRIDYYLTSGQGKSAAHPASNK